MSTKQKETRELTQYDLDKMIEQGTFMSEHPIIQQLAVQRIAELAKIAKEAK